MSIADNRTFLEKFEYVICDECHFFTSDSTFNPTTALILDKLIRGFQHATRIYMSSTFTDCLPYLFRYEKEIHGLLNPTPFTYKKGVVHPPYDLTFKYFLFERDYSYFNIRYYANHSDLRNIIIESIINTEKWLIFIDSRKQCKQLKNVLLEYYDEKYGSQLSDDEKALTDKDIKLIDASSKDDDEYMESISAEKFDCKILISTSVIDNGVNIKDSDLKHVVISDINKSKCLQMVGRKRIEHGEPVNLYVKVFCEEYINDRIVDLEYQKEIYGIYNRAYDNNYNTKNKPSEILNAKREFYNKHYNNGISDFENAKRWFYRDDQHPEIVKPNEIAVSLVDSVLIPRYEFILKRMIETGSAQEFLEHQLSWFGEIYDEANNITFQSIASAQEDFMEFANSLLGRLIPKDEKELFGIEFFKMHNKAYGLRTKKKGFKSDDNPSRTRVDGYGKSIINEIFDVRKIALVIETDKAGIWKIREK